MNNPFSLFDLPVAFEVNQTLLSERYLALQKSLHPDNFSTATSQEQRLAVQKSAEINDALQILKDPILRAEAIIALHTDSQQDLEQKSQKDMAFLMQQMEWREDLQAIEAASDEAKLAKFADQIQAEKQYILSQLAQTLAEQMWAKADSLTDKLRFIKKLQQEIERVEERLAGF